MTSGCPEEETALQPNWKCLITRTPVSQVEWTCIHPRSSPQESRTCYTCGRAGHLARRCPQSKQESRGRPANPGGMKQVSTGKSDNRKSQSRQPEPEDFLHSSSDDDATSKVQLVDKGSVAQCVQVEIQGVPAYTAGLTLPSWEADSSRELPLWLDLRKETSGNPTKNPVPTTSDHSSFMEE